MGKNIVNHMIIRCLICLILMHLAAEMKAVTDIEILQPTRDLMPLVGTRAMMQDSEGYVWYGTVEGGLCRDNGYQIDVFRNDRNNPQRIGQSNGIMSICEDANGNIIFGTRKNIFVLDKADYSIRQLNKTIPDGRVMALKCDKRGMILAVTESSNYIFDKSYRLKDKSKSDTTMVADATCRFTDIFGNEWSGGMDMENRIRVNSNRGIEKHKAIAYPAQLSDIRHDFIEADGGYLGHTNKEVFWTKTIEPQPGNWHKVVNIGTRISCVAVSKGGWLYVGDETGLYRAKYRDSKTEGKIETVADSLGNIRKMVAAPGGGVYFITPHCELAYCSDGGKVSVMQRGTDSKALTVTDDDTVWTTDWFGSVFRYDKKQGKLIYITDASMDIGDPINAMTCDADGNLWMVTDKMIKEYTTAGQQRIIYNHDIRIGVSQFLDIFSYNGRIIVTCTDAMLTIDPQYRSNIPHRPALTTAYIDDRTIYSLHDNMLTIPADASLVELYFSTFNHVDARSVQYEYRMNGRKWQRLDAGDNHIALVNLHKGKYDIEVRATDADGFYGNETLQICLDRLPAWWETWWAYTIYVVCTIVIIVATDRMWQRYKAAKRKVTELQARLDEYLRKEDTVIDKVAERITDNSADREFIERAVAIVEANMSNSNLDINMLCAEMAMSKSSLYRKFADITGQKPTEFVRSIRLKRAAELIKTGEQPISEIAYVCGFASPSYFNRRFKEMFGTSPTEYR